MSTPTPSPDTFDADEWLGRERDIFGHPYLMDRNGVKGYEVAELMADFAAYWMNKPAESSPPACTRPAEPI